MKGFYFILNLPTNGERIKEFLFIDLFKMGQIFHKTNFIKQNDSYLKERNELAITCVPYVVFKAITPAADYSGIRCVST